MNKNNYIFQKQFQQPQQYIQNQPQQYIQQPQQYTQNQPHQPQQYIQNQPQQYTQQPQQYTQQTQQPQQYIQNQPQQPQQYIQNQPQQPQQYTQNQPQQYIQNQPQQPQQYTQQHQQYIQNQPQQPQQYIQNQPQHLYNPQQLTSFSVKKPPVENLKNTINQRCQSFMFNPYMNNSTQKINYLTPRNTSINTRIKTLTEVDTQDSLSNNTSIKINRDMEVFNRSLYNNTINKPINSRDEYIPPNKKTNYKDIVFQADKLESDYTDDAFSGVILSDNFQGIMKHSKSYNSLNRSLSVNNNPNIPYNRE